MANTITFFRIAAGIVLLFCPVFSPAFYALYIAAGLSDMLDGFVARKTDTVSKLGAKLDTIADLVLVVVCLIKLLPILSLPAWLYVWIGIIALIKVVNIISGFAVQKKLVAVHSVINKATGKRIASLTLRSRDREEKQTMKFKETLVVVKDCSKAFKSGHIWIRVDSGS